MAHHPIIVWYRRDLRVDDHPALFRAAAEKVQIVPLFVFDKELMRSLPSDGAAFNFQAEALTVLQGNIRKLGGRLVIRKGNVLRVHEELIREVQPAALYYNRDYEPYATERDKKVEALYRRYGIEVKSFADVVVHEPHEVLTGKGTPFAVFTPFANAWKKLHHPAPLGRPGALTTPRLATELVLDAQELRRPVTVTHPILSGGEDEAVRAWREFVQLKLSDYSLHRDSPSVNGTSRISPYLRFGCLSARRVLDDSLKLMEKANPSSRIPIGKFVDELIWREFYQAVLFHFPDLLNRSYRREFDAMPWRMDEKLYKSWCNGTTGFPLVDAGMRQLNQTGWMHNRVRMVVASFLTKDLRHDWRLGASYFESKLMDIETASNNGGWQWAASTGVDPKPLRIFNPRLQSERYDPDGQYIGSFVPELQSVPAKFIHAPHTMPPVLQKEVGCIIGKNYPFPVVDHATASVEYKKLFAALKATCRRE